MLRGARPADAGEDDYICPGEKPNAPFVGIDKIHYRYLRSTDWDSDAVAVVEKLVLPYTAESGPMLLTLREEVA